MQGTYLYELTIASRYKTIGLPFCLHRSINLDSSTCNGFFGSGKRFTSYNGCHLQSGIVLILTCSYTCPSLEALFNNLQLNIYKNKYILEMKQKIGKHLL